MVKKPTYEELENRLSEIESQFAGNSPDKSRYNAIVETAVDAIIVVDDQARIVKWPSQAELLCGWSSNEIIGQPIFKIMPERYRNMHKSRFQEVISGSRGNVFGKRIEASVMYRDEYEVPVELAVALTKADDHHEITLFMHDITERKKGMSQLHQMSVTDDLTGIFNRRGFLTLADKQLKIACRSLGEIFLVYVDFDNMKWINDNLGHKYGDEALIETTEILKKTFREADLIGRVGGDEFVVLLTDKKNTKNENSVIKRLEKNINQANSLKNRQYKVLLSIGIVHYDPEAPCNIEDLMSKADLLMYENKKQKKEAGLDQHLN
ncbi:MAG: sensor domain-containing diguanylate cyclase [Proteobacteria bacterium]|nr:sensor domain-containing diguanylate cyclase [Pseudomonadota bacterium]MBU1714385.1 sensor domain-containing diguanylate cyclase [Pseudomonadota bacterium]